MGNTINFNYICVLDWETGSRNPEKTQPTQLSSLMIEPRKLKIVEGSLFNSEIKPIFDDKIAIEQGLDPVEDEALSITHKTRESLEQAPDISSVWSLFVEYLEPYKTNKKNSWSYPIFAGMNCINFDWVICNRMAKKFGQWDDKWNSQKIFHPVFKFDLLQEFWKLAENVQLNNSHSISLDSMRTYFGMNKDGAHDAKNDILDTAEFIIRFLKLSRMNFTGIKCGNCHNNVKVKFENALAGWKRPNI